ncbi:hypothetical protein [Sandarakinorhabdus sp.]
MTNTLQNLSRNVTGLFAALLISTVFIGAAIGPAMVTPTANSVIVA